MYKKPKSFLNALKKIPRKPNPNSRFAKFHTFFASKDGHGVAQWIIGGTALTLGGIQYLPQVFFVENYRDSLQFYEHGVPKEVPKHIQERVDEAVEKVNIPPFNRDYVRTFMVTGFDLRTLGNLKSVYFGWLGIPVNYLWKSAHDNNKSSMMIGPNKIKWNSEYGKLLEEALILTKEEQIFGMSNGILELNTHKNFYDGVLPMGVVLAMYTAARYINHRENLYIRPPYMRYIIYSMISLFGCGVYWFIKDLSRVVREGSIDKKLAALGPDMALAGVGYYDKILKKNIALNGLSGKNWYTNEGNEKRFIRRKGIPLTARKMYFEYKAEEYKKEQEKTDTEDSNKNVADATATDTSKKTEDTSKKPEKK